VHPNWGVKNMRQDTYMLSGRKKEQCHKMGAKKIALKNGHKKMGIQFK